MKNVHKALSLLAAIACIIGMTGCSTNTTETSDEAGTADQSKFASSMTDLIDSYLSDSQYDESQKEVLRAALQHEGEIPYASYSKAWESYRQCLVDKGYTKPPQNLTNGIYFAPAYVSSEGMSDAQNRKLYDDIDACRTSRVAAVDHVYRTQLGNPEFYGDPEVALVDCLHRKNLVSRSYTVEQYREEYDAYANSATEDATLDNSFSFDFNSSDALTCVATNIPSLLQPRLEIWKPLG